METTNVIRVVTKPRRASLLMPGDTLVMMHKDKLYMERIQGQFINDHGMCVIEWVEGDATHVKPDRVMEVFDHAQRD